MPDIGITLGDPSGIGPEIVAATIAALDQATRERIVLFGDVGVLERAGAAAGGRPGDVHVEAVTRLAADQARPGRPDAASAHAQIAYLEAGVAAALAGRVGALVTAPIHKANAVAAGFPFPGHTEMLASRAGVTDYAMLMAGPRLRVALVTTHVPLAEVPRRLAAGEIARVAILLARSLRSDFAIASPRIAICGLNPHAGEGGLFGDEERRVVEPGIDDARRRLGVLGVPATLEGPAVPDAVFRVASDGGYDGVVALYHDQGLIPVKLLEFDNAVNVTLGLPFVRTSPDHGVAYDIAGTGRARAVSFQAALDLARRMLAARRRAPA